MSGEKYFILYQNCIPVKGAQRSTICDLQKETFIFIPNDLYDILLEYKSKSIEKIKADYGKENEPIIDSYFDFLISGELGFWATKQELDFFPELDTTWDEPAYITNAIVDIDEKSNLPYQKILQELAELGCKHVQLRVYCTKKLTFFNDILEELEGSSIVSLEVITQFDANETISEDLNSLLNDFPRLHYIVIHSSPKDEIIHTNLIFTKDKINSDSHCGIISPEYFAINIKSYTEGLKFNSCLNRKVGIDTRGQVKNCPSLKESYGDIREVSLKEVVMKKQFKEYWGINKDQINTCRDCEFRRICTDCRAFVNDDNDHQKQAKPLKCNYDPYNTVWS